MNPPSMPRAQVAVVGIPVDVITPGGAVNEIQRWIVERVPSYVCVTSMAGVVASRKDERLKQIYLDSGLSVPDGQPMVWAGKLLGVGPKMEQVRGPDLMLDLCQKASREGWRVFLYGAAPGTAERLRAQLCAKFPGLQVVGADSPPYRPLTDVEAQDMARRIDSARADLVFVGISTPKQEKLMMSLRPHLDAPAMLGVGAAFDIHAGLVSEAPRWMMSLGLEWLYWLLVQPGRRWRQYGRNIPIFLVELLRQWPELRTGKWALSDSSDASDRLMNLGHGGGTGGNGGEGRNHT